MSDQNRIRILLADDHAIVRAGLAALMQMEPDMAVVGEAGDGEEAVSLYRKLRPDLLVLELRMPRLHGLGVMREVLEADRRARILVLTIFDGDQDISRSLKAGARGYLLKDTLPGDLLDAVRAIYAGRSVVSPSVAVRVAEHLTSESLTPREIEVLRQIADGKANKEIAFELDVSEGTAKTHVCNILQKLGCASRAEAISVAARRGFLRF